MQLKRLKRGLTLEACWKACGTTPSILWQALWDRLLAKESLSGKEPAGEEARLNEDADRREAGNGTEDSQGAAQQA